MKTSILAFLVAATFMAIATPASAQFKMDGNSLVRSSNSTVGKIESDGRTIQDQHGSTIAKVNSDGKSISDSHNATVLHISGDVINDAHGSTVGHMSDVTRAIAGARPEAAYVALWWFIVKGNH